MRCMQYSASVRDPSDGERDVTTVELPWALDVPMPVEAPEAVPAPAGLTRGIIVGLGVSAPLWLGIFWLVSWLATTLQLG